MLARITQTMKEKWGEIFANSSPSPSEINYLGMPGSLEGGTTSFLAFADSDERPCFFVKIARLSSVNNYIYKEAQILKFLNGSCGAPLLYHLEEKEVMGKENISFLITSVVKGQPMNVRFDREKPLLPDPVKSSSDMKTACGHLYEIRKISLAKKQTQLSSEIEERVNPAQEIEEFEKIYNPALSSQKQLCRELKDFCLKEFENIPDIIIHGDFCRQNILIWESRAGKSATESHVVDWSFASTGKAHLHDIFFFAASYFLQARKSHGIKGFMESFENTFFEHNKYSEAIISNIVSYAEAIGIPTEKLFYHMLVFLVTQSVHEYKRTIRCAGEGLLPGIVTYLASSSPRDIKYDDALKEQHWVYYFQKISADKETARSKFENLVNTCKGKTGYYADNIFRA